MDFRSDAARALVERGARRLGVDGAELGRRKPSAQHAIVLYLVGRDACERPVAVSKSELCTVLGVAPKVADEALRKLKRAGVVAASPRLGEEGGQLPNEYAVDFDCAAGMLSDGLRLYGRWPDGGDGL